MRLLRHLPLDSILVLIGLLTVLQSLQHVNGVDDDSLDPVEISFDENLKPVCEQSDSDEYFNCIESYNEKLTKRETITIEDLEACAATRKNCLTSCNNNIKHNNPCNKDKCPVCPTLKLSEGYKRIIVEGQNKTYKYDMPIISGQNITTIIKLTNLINNTNIVDIPTNINSTNINNIHIYNNDSSETGGNFGLGYTREGSCCLAVQPQTCKLTSNGPRCHHKRHKTCGQQCTGRIIHAQSRVRCTRSTGCQNRIGYVPQPRQPRCVYTSQWPHVSCGGQYQGNCDGCYDHYGYGSSNYYSGGRYPRHCTGCYDDAFDQGPLYRRGPVYQPFNYHQPPCYFTGTCGMPMCNAYGCFGNEYIDPAFGYQNPYYQNPGYGAYGGGFPTSYGGGGDQFNDYDIEFVDEIGKADRTENKTTNAEHTSASWGVVTYKCKVVGDDGAITIRNCTSNELEGNPFASSPSQYPYYPPARNESPDYLYDPGFDVPATSNRESRFYRNSRHESIYDDYINDDISDQPARRGHRKRDVHNKRKVQIVYDENENNTKER